MARKVYEIKLKERFMPALSEDDALDLLRNGDTVLVTQDDFELKEVVQEDHTMKLFILAKTMMSTEKFNCEEIEVAVSALATRLGYFVEAEEIAECIIKWSERLDDLTLSELEEWIIG